MTVGDAKYKIGKNDPLVRSWVCFLIALSCLAYAIDSFILGLFEHCLFGLVGAVFMGDCAF